MKKLLYLDDQRNPFINGVHLNENEKQIYDLEWVTNYHEFRTWIFKYKLPDIVSFDHDLAPEHYTPEYFWDNYEESKKFQEWKSQYYKEKTGLDCARLLIQYCKALGTDLPIIKVHSANPVGADNIKEVIIDYNYKIKPCPHQKK